MAPRRSSRRGLDVRCGANLFATDFIALALISPLRARLHEEPLPLDVAPRRDLLAAVRLAP